MSDVPTSDPELLRFRRKVRSEVRQYAGHHREPPPLTLWASEGSNPRRVKFLRVGAAADEAGVRANIVEGIKDRRSSYAAIGRTIKVEIEGGELLDTAIFGLVVVSARVIETWEVDIVAGAVAGWRPAVLKTSPAEQEADAWFFVQQAVRAAGKEPT